MTYKYTRQSYRPLASVYETYPTYYPTSTISHHQTGSEDTTDIGMLANDLDRSDMQSFSQTGKTGPNLSPLILPPVFPLTQKIQKEVSYCSRSLSGRFQIRLKYDCLIKFSTIKQEFQLNKFFIMNISWVVHGTDLCLKVIPGVILQRQGTCFAHS